MLDMICSLLGTPNDRIWPGLPSMPHAATVQLPYQPYNFLKKVRVRGGTGRHWQPSVVQGAGGSLCFPHPQ
jgi:hypothetical protein